jgi:hypothetical protein
MTVTWNSRLTDIRWKMTRKLDRGAINRSCLRIGISAANAFGTRSTAVPLILIKWHRSDVADSVVNK